MQQLICEVGDLPIFGSTFDVEGRTNITKPHIALQHHVVEGFVEKLAVLIQN